MPLQSNVRFKGLTQLTAALEKGRRKWPKEANALTKKSSGEVLDLYKDNLSGPVPSTAVHPLPVGIRTGDLLAGAEIKQVNQYRADVVNDVPYAGFIEDGTVFIVPRRPLANAVEQYTGGDLPNDANQVMVNVWQK
jgi:hypothetical protein